MAVTDQSQAKYSTVPWVALAILLFTAYSILFLRLDALPFLDLPAHVVRSHIIYNLLWGTGYQELFSVELGLQPYVWGDIALGILSNVFGPIRAAQLWLLLSFALIPASALMIAKRLNFCRAQAVFLFFVMLYIATDWFFLAAFINFRISVAISFFALALLLTNENKPSALCDARSVAGFLLAALCVYLLHFASFFFLCIACTCICIIHILFRQVPIIRALIVLLPLATLGIYHISQSAGGSDFFQIWKLRTWFEKVKAVGSMLVRFDLGADVGFAGVLFALILIAFWLGRSKLLSSHATRELFVVCFALGITYLSLPVAVATLSDVDGRALPFLISLTVILAARISSETTIRIYVPIAATFATVNLLYLAPPLLLENRFLRSYQEALQQLPGEKRLLPVTTHQELGRIHTTTHAGDIYSIWGEGFTPYIPNAYLGEPFTYFHYRGHFYAPLIFWYERKLAVDWPEVARFYNFVIVTRPFDREIFPQQFLEIYFENEAATIFKVRALDEFTGAARSP